MHPAGQTLGLLCFASESCEEPYKGGEGEVVFGKKDAPEILRNFLTAGESCSIPRALRYQARGKVPEKRSWLGPPGRTPVHRRVEGAPPDIRYGS